MRESRSFFILFYIRVSADDGRRRRRRASSTFSVVTDAAALNNIIISYGANRRPIVCVRPFFYILLHRSDFFLSLSSRIVHAKCIHIHLHYIRARAFFIFYRTLEPINPRANICVRTCI